MTYRSELITLDDGRSLHVAEAGDASGVNVLFHHGTPGSALLVNVFDNAASERGVRLLSLSRAGYGPSSRRAGRDVADIVSDARSVLDHFGAETYVSLGWSGGGPHALACGALDAPRCRGVISLAGVAPRNSTFNWTEGMGPENIEEFALALEGGPRYEEHIKSISDAGRELTEETVVEFFGGLLSAPDREVLEDRGLRRAIAASTVESGSVAHFGFLDDDQALLGEWGFSLDDIAVPTEIWFGDQDLMVPPSHGRYLSSHIASATTFHRASEGHASIYAHHLNELFEHLRLLSSTF